MKQLSWELLQKPVRKPVLAAAPMPGKPVLRGHVATKWGLLFSGLWPVPAVSGGRCRCGRHGQGRSSCYSFGNDSGPEPTRHGSGGMGRVRGMPPQGVCMPRQNPPKVHIHGKSPNVTADSRGTVVEALCERYKLELVSEVQAYNDMRTMSAIEDRIMLPISNLPQMQAVFITAFVLLNTSETSSSFRRWWCRPGSPGTGRQPGIRRRFSAATACGRWMPSISLPDRVIRR